MRGPSYNPVRDCEEHNLTNQAVVRVIPYLMLAAAMASAQTAAKAALAQNNAPSAKPQRPGSVGKPASYLAGLKHSLEAQTEFARYQPNGAPLWDSVRQTVNNFLNNEWRRGVLKGSRPQQAYYVRCDRTTMSQNDINQGRLIVVVGVAPERPAEFVILRVTQQTAVHK